MGLAHMEEPVGVLVEWLAAQLGDPLSEGFRHFVSSMPAPASPIHELGIGGELRLLRYCGSPLSEITG
jgi:hypothetical protein